MGAITELKLQKNKNRVNVYLDGEFACGMEMSVVLSHGLKVGEEIDSVKLLELRNESDYNKAYDKALDLLNRQKYTVKALRTKLQSKGYDEEIIDKVVERLKSNKLLSDKDFAESFIRSTPLKSKREIQNALIGKGVSSTYIAMALEEVEVDDEVVATRLAEKFMRYKEPTEENKTKLLAYLYRKGFGFSVAEKVTNSFGQNV